MVIWLGGGLCLICSRYGCQRLEILLTPLYYYPRSCQTSNVALRESVLQLFQLQSAVTQLNFCWYDGELWISKHYIILWFKLGFFFFILVFNETIPMGSNLQKFFSLALESLLFWRGGLWINKASGVFHNYYISSFLVKHTRESFFAVCPENLVKLLEVKPTKVLGILKTACPVISYHHSNQHSVSSHSTLPWTLLTFYGASGFRSSKQISSVLCIYVPIQILWW